MVAHAAVVAQTSLPTITVTGTTDGYGSITDTSSIGIGHEGMAKAAYWLQLFGRKMKIADVCNLPGDNAFKRTTARSDQTARWLAAQYVFNTKEMFDFFSNLPSNMGPLVIRDGIKHHTFTITYADGATERWVVTPNYRFSSMKLFDDPLPGSLKPSPTPRVACGA